MSKKVTLICENCLSRNYHTKKSPNAITRLSLKKFCKCCNCVTIHKESK